ncbi:MAG: phosphoribosyltransferase [Acetobacteraceae bacterium]
MTFRDRAEAGRTLAARLVAYKDRMPLVLALPRGGVPVGYEIARALAAPLDVMLVRKLAAPGQPELAIGAIALGADPEIVTDPDLIAALGISDAELAAIERRAFDELYRKRALFLAGRPPVLVAGRTAILVDDGIATGATMRAALRATRAAKPERITLAVPVAPPDTLKALASEADEIVCLERPRRFTAVGRFYQRFPQLDDREVIVLLEQARSIGQGGTE